MGARTWICTCDGQEELEKELTFIHILQGYFEAYEEMTQCSVLYKELCLNTMLSNVMARFS